MRKHGPVNIIMYFPKTEAGALELSKRVSEVHANAVAQRIKSLHCPPQQKLSLLDAVIETAAKRSKDQSNARNIQISSPAR